MAQISEDQIHAVIVAARALAKSQRPARPRSIRPSPSTSAAVREARRQALAPTLAAGSAERERLEVLCARYDRELQAGAEKALAESIAASPEQEKILHAHLANHQQATEALVSVDPPGTVIGREWIGRAFAIEASDGLTDVAMQRLDNRSYGKFKLHSSASFGTEKMTFWFLWTNPLDTYAVIQTQAYLSAFGWLQAGTGSQFLEGDISQIGLRAEVLLKDWSTTPQTVIHATSEDTKGMGSVQAKVPWNDFVGAIESVELLEHAEVRRNVLWMAPKAVLTLEVCARLDYYNEDGTTLADFASGAYQVIAPGVMITTLNKPPA